MNLDKPGRTAIDAVKIDSTLLKPNKYWKFFESYVSEVFGTIAEFENGRVINEDMFLNCYVSDWYKDELAMIPKAALPQALILDVHPDFKNLVNLENVEQIKDTLLPKNKQKILLILGDIGIGKTSLIGKYVTDYKDSAYLPYINLRGIDNEEGINASILTQLKEYYLAHLPDYFIKLKKHKPEVDFEIFNKELTNIEGELSCIQNDDEKTRRKYTEIKPTKEDPLLYTKRLVSFFYDNNVPSCVVLDGGDYFENEKLQLYLYTRAHRLCEEIGCCILIALRETSIPKALRNSKVSEHEGDIRYHLLPPKGSIILEQRRDYLIIQKLEKLPDTLYGNLSKEKTINFLRASVNSLLSASDDLELLANYSVRALLDYVRCFVMSGNIVAEKLAELEDGKTIAIHNILRCLLLYTYSSYAKNVNLILNVYDNNENKQLAKGQNLIRVRCLQQSRN